MKLLIVGNSNEYAIERFYIEYLKKLNVNVQYFGAHDLFLEYYNKSKINKLLYRAGLSTILSKINKSLIKAITEQQPDIIWIFKGMEVTPHTLNVAKAKGIKVVNYNPDNPFIFTGKGSGNANITNSIKLYDFHFTYNHEIEQQLQTKYKANTAILPFGFDVSDELYEKCAIEKEIHKVCFLGNPDKSRAMFLEQIAENGIEIDVFGNAWNKFVTHKNITIYKAVYGVELWKVLRKYRVQINLMRIHNLNSHNMRTFEVAGIGGIQLAPYTKEHQQFFEEGKEIFLYKDLAQCVEKINYLLSLSLQQANELRNNARQAAINKKYTYYDRSVHVYETLKSIL